jgi:hypothetical protein
MKFVKYLLLLFLIPFLQGCEDKVELDFARFDKRLVVEGWITDEPRPYYVNLSYTSIYTYKPDTVGAADRAVKGAVVSVADDLGNEYQFKEIFPGLYESDQSKFRGQVGRSYTLKVSTSEGVFYNSYPELLNPVTPLENIYYEFTNRDEGEYEVYIDTYDPPGYGNYYQWKLYYDGRLFDNIDILKDDYIDGNPLKRLNKESGNMPTNATLNLKIEQLSLTKSAYDFLYLFKEQSINVGTLWDTPPAPVIGNVFKEGDVDDYALGYFGASAVSSKFIEIAP